MSAEKNKQGRGFKEVVRKWLVTLKRSPKNIPLVALLAEPFLDSEHYGANKRR